LVSEIPEIKKSFIDKLCLPSVSLLNFSGNKELILQPKDEFTSSNNLIAQKKAGKLKKEADKMVLDQFFEKAVTLYKESLIESPEDIDVYYNLGKVYSKTGDYEKAINAYKKIIEITPNDIEVLTMLGESYKKNGDNEEALKYFKQATDIDPKYDLAQRQLKETENLMLEKTMPFYAQEKRKKQAEENLIKALNIVMQKAPADLSENLFGIKFTFSTTGSLSGHPNIAQYEYGSNTTVITDKYIWAAPEVVAAYIVHESVHSRDNDPFTSIAEEQDAYKAAVKFWIESSNGIKDPELDYAKNLYLSDPADLDRKVEQVYSSRDKSMPANSPSHLRIAYPDIKGVQMNLENVFMFIRSKIPSLVQNYTVSYDGGLTDDLLR
jgi:tetratricopeptide (TPR) repeat protein